MLVVGKNEQCWGPFHFGGQQVQWVCAEGGCVLCGPSSSLSGQDANLDCFLIEWIDGLTF
jgi:hypothetical protein